MPYRVTLRSTKILDIEAPAGPLPDFTPAIRAAVPDGYELITARAHTGTGTVRSTETRDVETQTLDELAPAAPDGWQALSVIATS